MSGLAGRIARYANETTVAAVGAAIVALGMLILLIAEHVGSTLIVGLALAVLGIGHGVFAPPNNNIALGSSPPDRMGIASSLINLARLAGQLISTALAGMLIALLIGNQRFTPENVPALKTVLYSMTTLALVCSVLGTVYSLLRRNTAEAESL